MMADIWTRLNGQHELRENLRVAIRTAGMTQVEAARRSGVKYSRLTAGLRGSVWLRRDDVGAICDSLGTTVEAILGNSIFKGDPRSTAFDHRPPDHVLHRNARASARRMDVRVSERAICCQCGGLSQVADRALPAFVPDGPDSVGMHRGRRLLASLECQTCRARTTHALMRLGGTDPSELDNRTPTQEEVARHERDALIRRLAEFNVEVHFRSRRRKNRADGYLCKYEYDESKSIWRIEIDPNAPARVQVSALSDCWRAISEDDHGPDVDWNPRDGVIATASSDAWGSSNA
jgi:hypothetical protein